jgi:DNA-binding MarR family transcriptional regulator
MSSPQAYEDLLLCVTRTYHRLTAVSDRLHGEQGITTGHRSVLLRLEGGPPPTISEIAADRAVSRQFIQRLVAELVDRGWVTALPNPRHRRASLLSLTPEGRTAVVALREREADVGRSIELALSGTDLIAAADILRRLSAALEPWTSER